MEWDTGATLNSGGFCELQTRQQLSKDGNKSLEKPKRIIDVITYS